MIEKIISYCIRNRIIVILFALGLTGWGIYAMQKTPVDAIPDLSDNQVIVFTEWMGRNPQVMEDQITFPLVSNLQGIPKVKDIRASSMFGMSFVFVIFEDDADIYWARSRVLERLNYASKFLPEGVTPTLGPDGTGVGHVYWYTLDAPGYDLGELRAIQDWYVRYALQTVQGVSEVATVGGMEKQYQIDVDPYKLVHYNVSLMDVISAVKKNNNEVGGKLLEMNDMSYLIRGRGYIKDISDIENIPVASQISIPIRIKDVATVQMGGDFRLGILDENGEGEKVGGIIVMRYGENAKDVIVRVKEKIKEVEKGLPNGVKIKMAYDRSTLIEEAMDTLRNELITQMIVVSIVVLVFLLHFGSSLVVISTLPIAVLISFILMHAFGITSNIMSLGGIAMVIGVIVDAGIVMVENAYRHLSEAQHG